MFQPRHNPIATEKRIISKKMDIGVKIPLLSKIFESENLELKENGKDLQRDLQICMGMLNSNLKTCKALSESDRNFLTTIAKEIELCLDVNLSEIFDAKLRSAVTPPELLITSFPGCLSCEEVGAQPNFFVRGKKYLKDNKKVLSSGSLFCQRACQVVYSNEEHIPHAAELPWIALPRNEPDSEYLIMNYSFPGSTSVQLVITYLATPAACAVIRSVDDPSALEKDSSEEPAPWASLLRQFYTPDNDQWINKHLKLIPQCEEAPWIIRTAVGQRPALTGLKIAHRYYRGPNYLEVNVDLSASSVASAIIGMVRGCSKNLVVDLGWTLQGDTEEELPEMVSTLICRCLTCRLLSCFCFRSFAALVLTTLILKQVLKCNMDSVFENVVSSRIHCHG